MLARRWPSSLPCRSLAILKRVPLLITFDSLLSTRKHFSALLHSTFLFSFRWRFAFFFVLFPIFLIMINNKAGLSTFSSTYCTLMQFLIRICFFCSRALLLLFIHIFPSPSWVYPALWKKFFLFSLPFARCTILFAERYFSFSRCYLANMSFVMNFPERYCVLGVLLLYLTPIADNIFINSQPLTAEPRWIRFRWTEFRF